MTTKDTPPALKRKKKDFLPGRDDDEQPAKTVSGKTAPKRMDRAGYKHGGAVAKKGTTVNVVIAGGQGAGAAPAAPMTPPVRPMPPAVAPPGAGGPPIVPPPGVGPRPPGAFKRGGAVMAGAGTGVARARAQKNGSKCP